MKQALDLLDQILVIAQTQAADLDAYNIMRHKALKTVGKNAVVHNLEMLRELLEMEQKKLESKPLDTTGGPLMLNGQEYNVAYGCQSFTSSDLLPNVDKLPTILNVGRRARITSNYWGSKTWYGREGVIEQHSINADNCSGHENKETYTMVDDDGVRFSANVEHCELC